MAPNLSSGSFAPLVNLAGVGTTDPSLTGADLPAGETAEEIVCFELPRQLPGEGALLKTMFRFLQMPPVYATIYKPYKSRVF